MNSSVPSNSVLNPEESDDEVKLPDDTLKILNEFLAEKAAKEQMEEKCVKEKCTSDVNFEENWQLSQFWYNDKTKQDLTKICQQIIKDDSNIALLSCPSLYNSIKNIHDKVKIFEYDERFASFGDDFVHYNFNEAENLDYLINFKENFDIVIADPPFISEECIKKMSVIIKRLMKSSNTKIMLCSGCIIEKWAKECLQLNKTGYKPEHERNLGNEFVLYTNFDINLDLIK